jgi:hypothetical protein
LTDGLARLWDERLNPIRRRTLLGRAFLGAALHNAPPFRPVSRFRRLGERRELQIRYRRCRGRRDGAYVLILRFIPCIALRE